MPVRLSALLLVAVLAATGCSAAATAGGGDHEGHGDAPPVAAGARTVAITASAFAFDPDGIELTAGEDVAIALTATDLEHDLVIDELDFHVAAGPGETARAGLRIDVPGTYAAYCSVPGHREAGMETTVTVTS